MTERKYNISKSREDNLASSQQNSDKPVKPSPNRKLASQNNSNRKITETQIQREGMIEANPNSNQDSKWKNIESTKIDTF